MKKNAVKLFGILAASLFAAIALTFFACGLGGDSSDDDDAYFYYSTDITIKSGSKVILSAVHINTPLSATYNGEMNDLSYQWKKNGTALTGETNTDYTPTTTGKYTITVNGDGSSVTSRAVLVYDQNVGLTAAEAVSDMTVGWNLGNTLDADGGETAWGNPKTTQANIDALKNAGFNTIRIPVSWHNGISNTTTYTISSTWMNRVKEVVDYAKANDMYIILNTHHDENIFKFKDDNATASIDAFGKIWTQIADTFKDYDSKLIFEGLNEPRTQGSSAEWNGGTSEERNNLNAYYVTFVNTVRARGGNNTSKRILMINPYGASSVQAALNGLAIPHDSAPNRIIVSYHAYEPYNFALNTSTAYKTWSKNNSTDTNPITEPINRAQTTIINKGYPVVIGEFGAMNKDNADTRAKWAEYYVKQAKAKGIPCVWWDNGVTTGDDEKFGLLNRSNNTFTYPQIVAALMIGANSSGE